MINRETMDSIYKRLMSVKYNLSKFLGVVEAVGVIIINTTTASQPQVIYFQWE